MAEEKKKFIKYTPEQLAAVPTPAQKDEAQNGMLSGLGLGAGVGALAGPLAGLTSGTGAVLGGTAGLIQGSKKDR